MKQHIDEIALTLWILLVFVGGVSAETLYVNETGWYRSGGAFNTTSTPIQCGADNATAGDTVYVWNGTYNENVNLTQASITLEGEGRDVVTLNASNTSVSTISVWNDHINVSGLTLQNATNATGDSSNWHVSGIFVHKGTDYCNITDNNMCYNSYGIYVRGYSGGEESTYIDIKQNNIYNNNGTDVIYIHYLVEELNFSNNIVYNNSGGGTVLKTYASNYYWNTIHNNTFYDNAAKDGCLYIRSDKFYISNNTIYNTTGSPEAAGIHIVDRNNAACIVEYNEVYSCDETGIHVCGADNVTIRYNDVHDNAVSGTYNMRVWKSEDTEFLENIVAQVNEAFSYRFDEGSKNIVITDEITNYNVIYLQHATPSEFEVKSTTNKIIKSNTTNLTYCYPSFANLSVNGSEIYVRITAYDGTITPGKTNVTISAVNSWSETGYNITVNSSNTTETCTFTADVVRATGNYDCCVDGVRSTTIQAIGGTVSWNYTSGFSTSHDLQISYNASGEWALSNFGFYYNNTAGNEIEITIKGYGNQSNLFSRVPTEADTNITSYVGVVVKTT